MNKNKYILLPAEWHPQSGVMLTWPHENSDWAYMLDEVEACFINIAREISKREKLLIICQDKETLLSKLPDCKIENIILAEISSNDTWARDHGAITVFVDSKPKLYDFIFNGWGMKFAANFDNQITQNLFKKNIFSKSVSYKNMLNFVLEGGSIESDGEGTLLTTEECLLSANRNDHLSKEEIEIYLKKVFGIDHVLWLSSGYLAGDDTDSHIDTLARFCDEKTIAYIKCTDSSDEHFVSLEKMEKQLQSFKTLSGGAYHLIELPMAEPVYEENNRLPATYANFLIINGAVLMPFYKSEKDQIAKEQLQKAFPDREIIGIDCLPLIRQHGSLHCVTMQFPEGVL
jgi:agmatine/peptidylarginine deiminase